MSSVESSSSLPPSNAALSLPSSALALTHAQAARQQEMLIVVQDSDATVRNAMYGFSQSTQAMVASLKDDSHADKYQVLAQDHAMAVLQGRRDGRFNSRSSLLVGKRERRFFDDAETRTSLTPSRAPRRRLSAQIRARPRTSTSSWRTSSTRTGRSWASSSASSPNGARTPTCPTCEDV